MESLSNNSDFSLDSNITNSIQPIRHIDCLQPNSYNNNLTPTFEEDQYFLNIAQNEAQNFMESQATQQGHNNERFAKILNKPIRPPQEVYRQYLAMKEAMLDLELEIELCDDELLLLLFVIA